MFFLYVYSLQILTKWGEYSNDVQFILQRSAFDSSKLGSQQQARTKVIDPLHSFTPTVTSPTPGSNENSEGRTGLLFSPDRNKDIRKSLTFSGGHHIHSFTEHQRGDNVGIVKGVPQVKSTLVVRDESDSSSKVSDGNCPSQNSPSECSASLTSNRNPGKREAPPYREPPRPSSPPQRTLPPYRDPPPPVHSPSRSTPPHPISSPTHEQTISSPPSAGKTKSKRNLLKVCYVNVISLLLYNLNYLL